MVFLSLFLSDRTTQLRFVLGFIIKLCDQCNHVNWKFIVYVHEDCGSRTNLSWSCCSSEAIWWGLCCNSMYCSFLFESSEVEWLCLVSFCFVVFGKKTYVVSLVPDVWVQWQHILLAYIVQLRCWTAGSGFFTSIFLPCRKVIVSDTVFVYVCNLDIGFKCAIVENHF